ncbi:hypothetical protein L227DRAFT_576925 [Lentinus tigrinus ALCF2SS1-6]|uniref:Uncharacterized protein n=1 Tax=Lentinus tigrinus ALCF2SS1-6 TaxID=1328759 RepID=A0A5C2S4P1_9APHY|nr:hypothetical protein L227DRAFT_576925 [Lentinus tigrinus ALCF2SS1-6]
MVRRALNEQSRRHAPSVNTYRANPNTHARRQPPHPLSGASHAVCIITPSTCATPLAQPGTRTRKSDCNPHPNTTASLTLIARTRRTRPASRDKTPTRPRPQASERARNSR